MARGSASSRRRAGRRAARRRTRPGLSGWPLSVFPNGWRYIPVLGWIQSSKRRPHPPPRRGRPEPRPRGGCAGAARAWASEAALVELLRGRRAILGPTSASSLAESVGVPPQAVDEALLTLES